MDGVVGLLVTISSLTLALGRSPDGTSSPRKISEMLVTFPM